MNWTLFWQVFILMPWAGLWTSFALYVGREGK